MSSPPVSRAPISAYDSPTFGEDGSFHVEQPVGSMSISPCGRDVVLASKEGLHVIDLDNPYSPPRYLSHRTPWEVADVQWSPFAARDSWVVSTSNQKALVWNLAMRSWENPIEHVLHAHSRAITDINFSAHHPDVLATCAVDSFVHCWDLRIPAKPVVSFSDWFAGATQVKWNRQDSHVIASSHDRFLHIWDDRKGALPIRTIEAHNTKIYGVDWNRMRPEGVVTCSLDKTIKFWDCSVESDIPEKVIHTPFPVWRARHTPFGWGVLAMPQRGNSDLHLYSRTFKDALEDVDVVPLVHSFPGHKGQVKEFLWRPRGTVIDGLDHREFQLVSWGTDKELRLHRVDPEVLKGVGYEKGRSFNPSLNLTRKGAVYKSFHDEPHGIGPSEPPDTASNRDLEPSRQPGSGMGGISMPYSRRWTQGGPMVRFGTHGKSPLRADMNPISWMRGVKVSRWEVETLGDEITHVGERFTRVAFESVNVGQRKVTISLHGPWGPENASVFLRIDIRFPTEYPKAAAPVFNVQKTTSVTPQLTKSLTSSLQTISEAYLSKERGCLEGILRFLLGEYTPKEIVAMIQEELNEALKSPDILEDVESSDEDEDVGQYQGNDLTMSSSELLRPVNANVMVPVRRSCGALWANDGRLVCFFPPKEEKVASFLDSIGLREMTRLSRSNRVFEAFGRFQTKSPGPKNITGTGASTGPLTDDDASDYSDNSDEYSSSSGSSDLLGALPQHFHVHRTSHLGLGRAKSTDNSQKSTTGISTMKSSNPKRHNTISIHKLTDLLPARRDLAQQYRTHGNGIEICSHNMAVAENFGNLELAHTWGLLKLLIEEQPQADDAAQLEDMSHMACLSMGHIKRRDSGVDLAYGNGMNTMTGGIVWGSHPFGVHWLLPALLDHFERLGDVQMLGMLSCLITEPNVNGSNSIMDHEDLLSDSHGNPSFSAEYISPPSLMQQANSSSGGLFVSPVKEGPLISASYGSACSSTDLWPSETPPLYSTGATPPTVVRSSKSDLERKAQRLATPVSGSPDQPSDPRNLNIVSTLPSSLSRSLPNEPLAVSSPMSGNCKRRPSPVGSLTTAGPSGWTGNGVPGKPPSAIPDHMHASTAPPSQAPSDTEVETWVSQKSTKSSAKSSPEPNPSKKSSKEIRAVFKHQEDFDSDHLGHAPSLMDHTRESLYQAYRITYANLLSAWDLPIAQQEVLGVKHLPSIQSSHRDPCLAAVSFDLKPKVASELNGLGLQRHCITCGSPLRISVFSKAEPRKLPSRGQTSGDQSGLNCSECKSGQQKRLSCTVCGGLINGTFSPCLVCGHISCRQCHEEWLIFSENCQRGSTPACPAGCGCRCSDHITVHVPFPERPQITVTMEPQAQPDKAKSTRRRRNRTADLRHTVWPLAQVNPYEEQESVGGSASRRFPSLTRSRSSVNLERGYPKNTTRRWKDDLAELMMDMS
ncbi:hypothetical protein D8B26_005682 [Coccidioides posadasii str. Silveira]|uniref:WD repeat protein n=2 Tax=Coccidioides posadasii TaxID=199306 RepID=E9DAK0_COCPS|nr:WD domain, G-beta repeat containing protein [Coccidioides posadasii C735 delta SOWgp]EER27147.1 WD domain, G-beta repeat containing protein [Coccidioides posadasii C735 delta SOWgp]EFW16337.1 WD repeat protein [Coccidioides posadasii str. Silveira]QVM11031.1 hypothetical protein D8B26_005682 [Coccidioides posadasii str. Silveira]|eukprot:XP_003069292.1 WD domain, G-beta repeat containing protein [Coccidioides posadasii C735 delta SOWgp]